MAKRARPSGWLLYGAENGPARFTPDTRRSRARARLRRFWRWYTEPITSLADITVIGAVIGLALALHVNHRWPWWVALTAAIAALCAVSFLGGFMGELIRRRRRR